MQMTNQRILFALAVIVFSGMLFLASLFLPVFHLANGDTYQGIIVLLILTVRLNFQ